MIDASLLAELRSFDTPTLCNAMEIVAPERRATGFTARPLVCIHRKLEPIVGFARTARVRASTPSSRKGPEARAFDVSYYRHIAEPPHPTVTVIEDVDDPPGFGAWWGEVNTHVHRGLGSLGVVTNGTVRDLDQVAERFQLLAGAVGPSHAHVHVVDFAVPVTVAGMAVEPGDLIHADRHGALVVPEATAAALPKAARAIMKGESVLIGASKEPGFGIDALEKILTGADH